MISDAAIPAIARSAGTGAWARMVSGTSGPSFGRAAATRSPWSKRSAASGASEIQRTTRHLTESKTIGDIEHSAGERGAINGITSKLTLTGDSNTDLLTTAVSASVFHPLLPFSIALTVAAAVAAPHGFGPPPEPVLRHIGPGQSLASHANGWLRSASRRFRP